jgi:hypothetical protein
MTTRKLTKPQKTLAAIIETEGATILAFRKATKHLKVDFTFDQGQSVHTQTLPYGDPIGSRWEANFRAAVRRCKPN